MLPKKKINMSPQYFFSSWGNIQYKIVFLYIEYD